MFGGFSIAGGTEGLFEGSGRETGENISTGRQLCSMGFFILSCCFYLCFVHVQLFSCIGLFIVMSWHNGYNKIVELLKN